MCFNTNGDIILGRAITVTEHLIHVDEETGWSLRSIISYA